MSEIVSSFDRARQKHDFAFFALFALLVYAFAIASFNIPSGIRVGWQAQTTIRMLDEMRRPFLAMNAMQNRIFLSDGPNNDGAMHEAQRAASAMLANYLDLARYNPALEREVRALSGFLETWAAAQNHLAHRWIGFGQVRAMSESDPEHEEANLLEEHEDANLLEEHEDAHSLEEHIHLMSRTEALFLNTMNKLGDGEDLLHADIENGRDAGRALFILSVMLAAYLTGGMFFDQHARARALELAYRKELRLQRLADFDSLTGLPNRALFNDRLVTSMAAARRDAARAAVLFVDLDGFKQINDRFGHEAGDDVLRETAKRLSSCVREVDTVARLGGDEFVILLGNIDDPADSVRFAENVVACLRRPFGLDANAPRIGASVGIAHYPDDGETYDDLVRAADCAMYEVKKTNKGSYRLASDPAPALVRLAATG